MDEIGKFAVDIKERYEMFFDAFSKKYPSGINFFNKKFMVGEIRNLFIVDVLAPVSMIYVMSDAKERKEMAAAAKYIFGLEDIDFNLHDRRNYYYGNLFFTTFHL